MKNVSVLVVGGSGFVGERVVGAFLNASKDVTVLNRGSRPISGTEQLVADRNELTSLEAVLKGRRFDIVIDTNCYTPQQARLLNQALRNVAGNIAVISSAAVYADHATLPPTENEPTGGASVWGDYGKDKSDMEGVYHEAGSDYDKCVILRPPYIFGPDNAFNRETWFWTRQACNRAVFLPGLGKTKAQFIHVDDVAEALIRISEINLCGYNVFNIADPTILSFSELATLLAEAAGLKDSQIAINESGDGISVRSWFPFRDYPCLASPERIMNELGWQPKMSLLERFRYTAKHYQLNLLAKTMSMSETEQLIARRLGIEK